MTCDVCQILENKYAFHVVYTDEKCTAILHEMPSQSGHVLLFPNNHFPIFEDVPDSLLAHMFGVANIISSSVFDSLQAMGTNILINNGIPAGQELPHFLINIIPRKENDGLNLEWVPKKAPEGDLAAVAGMLKPMLQAEMVPTVAKQPTLLQNEATLPGGVDQPHIEQDEEEDLMVKRLYRLP